MRFLKRILFLMLILGGVLVGLQYFGGRDFFQVPVAIDKYQQKSDLKVFFNDIVIIFKGGNIREGASFYSKIADKVIYKWKDESGELHISEIKPKNAEYETVKLSDLKYQSQESLSEEEINRALNKPKNKP